MTVRHFVPVAVFAAALFGLGCGDDDGDTTTLHVVEHADTDILQHIGPANEEDSIGDVLGFANPVYDADNQDQVGTDNGQCIRTDPGKAFECVWTLTLDEGQLTVEGPFYDTEDSTLAITGGTGDYGEARGDMTLHARNEKGTEYDFTYEIIK
jgi:allene oxide cyclase